MPNASVKQIELDNPFAGGVRARSSFNHQYLNEFAEMEEKPVSLLPNPKNYKLVWSYSPYESYNLKTRECRLIQSETLRRGGVVIAPIVITYSYLCRDIDPYMDKMIEKKLKSAYFKHFVEAVSKGRVTNEQMTGRLNRETRCFVTNVSVNNTAYWNQSPNTSVTATVQLETGTALNLEAVTTAVKRQIYDSFRIPPAFLVPYTFTDATTTATSAYQQHLRGLSVSEVNYNVRANEVNVTFTSPAASTSPFYGVDGQHWAYGHNPMGFSSEKPSIREIIRRRMSPVVIKKAKPLSNQVDPQEQKARDTLRDMISEAQYRRYITNGFIMVKGPKTGRGYQVFMDHYIHRIQVWENGKHINNICIHTDRHQNCPPTDHVINMKIRIECDEESLITLGNIHQVSMMRTDLNKSPSETKSLIDVLKETGGVQRMIREKHQAAYNAYQRSLGEGPSYSTNSITLAAAV